MTTETPTKPRQRRSAARAPTAEELFLASAIGDEKVVSRIETGNGGSVTFTHEGPKIVVLYRATSWGWESVEVPSSNVPMLLRAGLSPRCKDCGGSCSPDPMAPTPNACPGREKFATRRCPICTNGHVVYDFGARQVNAELLTEAPHEGNEDTEIDDGAYRLATPAARTKAALDKHILAYHPDEAAELGLVDLSQPSASVVKALADSGMALR